MDLLPIELVAEIFSWLNSSSDLLLLQFLNTVSPATTRNAGHLLDWKQQQQEQHPSRHSSSSSPNANETTTTTTTTTITTATTTPPQSSRIGHAFFIRKLTLGAEHLADIVDKDFIQRLASSGPTKLEKLSVATCRNLDDDSLRQLISVTSNLLSLDIAGTRNLSHQFLAFASSSLPCLTSLNLSNLDLTDLDVGVVARNCPRIKKLYLSGCSSLTDVAVKELAMATRGITALDLAEVKNLTKVSYYVIFGFEQREDSNLELLMRQSFEGLKELNLSGCSGILEDPNVRPSFAKSNRQNLRDLNLSGLVGFTDSMLILTVTCAPRMRALILSRCATITSFGLQSIASLAKNLNFLHLGHCINVTDGDISHIAKACSRLKYIDLANLHITDKSVNDITLSCSRLRRFSTVKCRNITSASVHYLLRVCRTIERVHLSYCPELDFQHVGTLVMNCRHLNYLTVSGCTAFLESVPQALLWSRPAPSTFTESQRHQYCVLGPTGISQFRDYLETHFEVIPMDLGTLLHVAGPENHIEIFGVDLERYGNPIPFGRPLGVSAAAAAYPAVQIGRSLSFGDSVMGDVGADGADGAGADADGVGMVSRVTTSRVRGRLFGGARLRVGNNGGSGHGGGWNPGAEGFLSSLAAGNSGGSGNPVVPLRRGFPQMEAEAQTLTLNQTVPGAADPMWIDTTSFPSRSFSSEIEMGDRSGSSGSGSGSGLGSIGLGLENGEIGSASSTSRSSSASDLRSPDSAFSSVLPS
ncbi:hypothetical protein HDU76_007860 [Blyttiomyces sp. JEL0837]|nr:hypothetical protein HDU76_007860 [Blyttiomyces sp. JEL0837]